MRKPKVRALGATMGKGGAYLLSIKLRVCGDFGVKFPDASCWTSCAFSCATLSSGNVAEFVFFKLTHLFWKFWSLDFFVLWPIPVGSTFVGLLEGSDVTYFEIKNCSEVSYKS